VFAVPTSDKMLIKESECCLLLRFFTENVIDGDFRAVQQYIVAASGPGQRVNGRLPQFQSLPEGGIKPRWSCLLIQSS